ncbi:MAG: pyruvate dehydrogenase (acetyl-transferring) E1 component subunit alpha [Deltaproteobacteria bacterium]|nr:pyruvate dehydrogenase (acetyl-transferring) E1 component subunit alpha [Deltaproteobacteria bacterium]
MKEAKTALEMYRMMLLIRRFEEEAARAYSLGKIGGFLHLYIGQESIAVGAAHALEAADSVVTTYRDHGIALARGMTANAGMAELFGKVTGCSKGLGGSMHFFDAPNRMYGGHGIIGAHIPLAAGVAFASKYTGDGGVTMVFYGDGSASIGATHEGMSLAALWKLPIVFVCENNQYAMGTSLERSISVTDMSKKADGYGMAKDRFVAEDVFEVRDRLKAAVDRARAGEGPTLVEILTYRYRGHSMSDPAKYRTKEEVEDYKKRDAIARLRTALEAAAETRGELDVLDAAVEAEVAECVRFADESPEPTAELLEPTTYAGEFAR